MLNLSPENKKILIFLIIMFVMIFSAVIIDFYLNAQMAFSSVRDFKPSKLEISLEELLAKPDNTHPSMIRKSLTEIFELMNNKEYEKLFSLVSSDFKKSMFDDNLNDFSQFMNSYASKQYSPYFTEYERFGNTYMVLVSFVPYSNTDEDIINTKKPENSDTFFIRYSDDGSYTFSLLGYVGEKELGNGVENSQFRVILNKTVLYKNKSEFYFTITNNSSSPISIDGDDIYCYTGVKSRFHSKPVYVSPSSSTDFTFSVGTGIYIPNAVPNEIYFKNVEVNGNKYSFYIDTDFCVNI